MSQTIRTKTMVLTISFFFLSMIVASQPITTTQMMKTPSAPFDNDEGYFLYTPIYGRTTYLINETGVVNHTWESAYTPNLDSYMLDNGTILLAIAFTSVIVLIADLDRPQAGLIQVSQQPLLDLLSRIGASAP